LNKGTESKFNSSINSYNTVVVHNKNTVSPNRTSANQVPYITVNTDGKKTVGYMESTQFYGENTSKPASVNILGPQLDSGGFIRDNSNSSINN
jgi:hypothetical protein